MQSLPSSSNRKSSTGKTGSRYAAPTAKAVSKGRVFFNYDVLVYTGVIYILKRFANGKDHAVTTGEAGKLVRGFFLDNEKPKNFQDKITDSFTRFAACFESAEHSPDPEIQSIVRISKGIFGGFPRAFQKKNGSKYVKYLYFEPLVSSDDMETIKDAIVSNRFLSEKEQRYLVSCLDLLTGNPPESDADNERIKQDLTQLGLNVLELENDAPQALRRYRKEAILDLPSVPKPKDQEPLLARRARPQETNTILQHIRIIRDAISHRKQIELKMGSYQLTEGNVVRFNPSSVHVHVLNPYALIWDRANYYLIAAYPTKEPVRPMHFRVDRIFDVRLRKRRDAAAAAGYDACSDRSPVPKALYPYFKTTKNGEAVSMDDPRYPLLLKDPDRLWTFDAKAYTARYLKMIGPSSKDADHLVASATLLCASTFFPVLIENFGMDGVHVKIAEKTPFDAEIRNSSRHYRDAICYYEVTVTNVNFQSLLLFCLQNQSMVLDTYPVLLPLSPKRLVSSFQDALQNTLSNLATLKDTGFIPDP